MADKGIIMHIKIYENLDMCFKKLRRFQLTKSQYVREDFEENKCEAGVHVISWLYVQQ